VKKFVTERGLGCIKKKKRRRRRKRMKEESGQVSKIVKKEEKRKREEYTARVLPIFPSSKRETISRSKVDL